jgi:hypothetical protein
MDSIAPTVQKAAKYAEENSLILGCGAAAAGKPCFLICYFLGLIEY